MERFAEASFDSVVGRQLVAELRAIRDAWSDSITSRRQAIVWHWRPVEATIPQCVASEHQLVAEVVVVGDFDDQLGQNGS